MPNRKSAMLEIKPVIDLLEEKDAHRQELDAGKIRLFRLEGITPCGICVHSVQVAEKPGDRERFYFCRAHYGIAQDSLIQCGCKAAKVKPGSEGVTHLTLSTPSDHEVWIDAITEKDIRDLDSNDLVHCGPLMVNIGGGK